ncbi:hypothetical protein [Alkalimarinus coralli]|uniref:hypothetical protein n=1 Tax=Alkalimarinus coralli TaxID=2935863 RepID=UPI00202B6A49|nr:hypothetical protein [Alkalimarinus coralli]
MHKLRWIGSLYLLSGAWCTFQPALASNFLGLELINMIGKGEFFTVYGGLQVGLGLAMIISSFVKAYTEAALYFSAIFSTSLLSFRLIALYRFGASGELIVLAILEALIAVILWLGWKNSRTARV